MHAQCKRKNSTCLKVDPDFGEPNREAPTLHLLIQYVVTVLSGAAEFQTAQRDLGRIVQRALPVYFQVKLARM